MKWKRIILAALAVPVAAIVVVTLAATGYATKLAWAARGAPDQARISQFAGNLGRHWWPVLMIVLTVPAAAWAARKAGAQPRDHGLAVGILAALCGLALGFSATWRTPAEFVLTIGAGWLGAWLATRARPRGGAMATPKEG